MKLTRHNEKWSDSYTLLGRKSNHNVEITYNAHLQKYYFYIKDKKSKAYYYSPWDDMFFSDEEPCINACMAKLDELVQRGC